MVAAAGAGAAASGGAAGKKKAAASKAGGGTTAKVKKARKRRPTVRPTLASTKELLQDAKLAAQDMATQRAQAAARRADPLWYKMEDVVALATDASNEDESEPPASSILPEQLQIVEAALSHHGLSRGDVTPQALACLLEQARRIAQELLEDAQDYAQAAHRAELTGKDLLLAADLRADTQQQQQRQLPKLNLIAQQMNRAPLPPIPSHCYSGIVLPAKPHQLTSRTYDLVSAASTRRKMVTTPPSTKSSRTSTPAPYGATKGRPIPVKLQTQAPAAGAPNATTGTAATSLPPTATTTTAAPGANTGRP